MSNLTRYKKFYFFNSPTTEEGEVFNTKNLPTRLNFERLFDSVAFMEEVSDGATVTQRGLIKLYSDQDSIDGRYNPYYAQGDAKSVRSHQLPGVGVLDTDFKEATYDEDSPVKGTGIKVTSLLNTIARTTGTYKKISYQIELDGSTIPVSTGDVSDRYVLVHEPGSDIVKKVSLDLILSAAGFRYQHDQVTPKAEWNFIHGLGKYPNVNVIIAGKVVLAEIEHISVNEIKITHTYARSGVAVCS